MKIYVKASEKSHELPYDYGYADRRPSEYMKVRVLGDTIGGSSVFCVQNPDNTWGYFWGKVPKTTLNLFGEFAMRLSPNPEYSFESSLGLDISNLSDSQIISAVNDRLLQYVDNPIADRFAEIFSIDWASCKWEVVCAHWIYIRVGNVGTFSISNTASGGDFAPDSSVFVTMINQNIPIDADLQKFVGYKTAKDSIKAKETNARLKASPYPEGITDNIAGAIHELYKFIVKQHLGYADTLYEAKEYVESKTINYKRSSRYGDSTVAKQIDELFDWASKQNITPQKLIQLSRKIYPQILVKYYDS